MRFSRHEIAYLVGEEGGGPCLELGAWFDRATTFDGAVRELCSEARAFGPCSPEPESLRAELLDGAVSGSVTRSDGVGSCSVVLALGDGLGPIVVRLTELGPGEIAASVSPDVVSRALGFGGWYDAGNTFPWGDPADPLPMRGVYARLGGWWTRLAGLPGCRALWLGYEGTEPNDLPAHAPAGARHLVTERAIAAGGPWSGWLELGHHLAAVPVAAVAAAAPTE